MLILAIETSCDETAASVVEDGTKVLSNVIASSRSAFETSGGVIPEEAAREQVTCILPVLQQTLSQADVSPDRLDALAVTRGPGLLGSLLVGTTAARTLARLWEKPLIGVHHTLGHLSSVWLETSQADEPAFPLMTLSASGGHTDLWYRTSHTTGYLLGRTRDDAAGEAFDKGAAMLGLPYPGGPSIAKAAEGGATDAFAFPHPLKKEDTLDFSYSGLKTSLRYLLRDLTGDVPLRDVAASYQAAICEHLIDRIVLALKRHPEAREVHITGGVSANLALRSMLREAIPDRVIRFPLKIAYCTDNAAMIGAAAEFIVREQRGRAFEPFETAATLPIEKAILRP